jgi:hypothetical protein
VWAILWPERASSPAAATPASLAARLQEGALVVTRPDGATDTIVLTDQRLEVK